MPLTKKGSKILSSMRAQYGGKKGEQVFYASINKGKIKGAEKSTKRAEGGPVNPLLEEARRRGKQDPTIQTMQNIARERRQMQMPPMAEARARGGRVESDAHERREMEMMREMMSMHPGMARGGPVCPTCGGPAHRAEGGPTPLPKPDPRYELTKEEIRGVPPDVAAGWQQQMHDLRARGIQRSYARGGKTGAGAYMVGERGPEMFMPDQPGTVIPHHELIRLARKYGGHVSNKRRR